MTALAYNRRSTDRPAPTTGMTQAQVREFCMARAAALRAAMQEVKA